MLSGLPPDVETRRNRQAVTLKQVTGAIRAVYVLELVGLDDRFASYEAGQLASGVELIAPGIATADALGPRIGQAGYIRHISELVGTTSAARDEMRALLAETTIDRSGSAAVRARRIRGAAGDTQAVERDLGTILVDHGFSIDLDTPDHELRVAISGDRCVLGWKQRSLEQGFSGREPTDRPFFRPGSMDPRLARGIVNIAGAGPGQIVCDPMCGTGGLLLEAALVGASVLASDIDRTMIAGTRDNLAALAPEADAHVFRGDAAQLAIRDDRADVIVFDAPYGRQSHVRSQGPAELVSDALVEAARITNRAVIVTDRPLAQPLPNDWTVTASFEHRVHRSLTRSVHVLGRG